MRFYFSDQRVREVTDRSLFWEESPERWRQAELEFNWDDIVRNTYLISYDERTGDLERALGTVVVDTRGGGLSVSIMPRVHRMYDYEHPRYRPGPDVVDFGPPSEDSADAGTRE